MLVLVVEPHLIAELVDVLQVALPHGGDRLLCCLELLLCLQLIMFLALVGTVILRLFSMALLAS